jgi:hypothetical protein
VRLDQERADEDIRGPRLTHEGGADKVVLLAKELHPVSQRAAAKIRPTFEDQAGGLAAGVRIYHLDLLEVSHGGVLRGHQRFPPRVKRKKAGLDRPKRKSRPPEGDRLVDG